MTYCEAVLRPEGIACTLAQGHEPYTFEDYNGHKWTTDHCNIGGEPRSRNQLKRYGEPKYWGFNNPVGRELGPQG